ncbi:MAG: diacylglycerol kinase [Albidovulum sp.]
MLAYLLAELARLKNTLTWSLQGFTAAWSTEKSLRQWVGVNIGSVALAFYLDLTSGERALIVALGLLILAAEIFNTAIEEVVNLVSPERHPSAGKAKDCGSAAVFLTALAGAAAWIVIVLG